jgi:methylglyoxal/glyoxal reductase
MVNKNNLPVNTTLNNGSSMPLLGLGVYDMYQSEAEDAVLTALETGYRLVDTAAMYNNEKEIGNAVRKSGFARNELFITTKVSNTQQGYDSTLKAFEASCKKLQMDYVDLYLVHWPIKGKRKDTWRALETLYNNKQVRAIGVANYLLPFLKELETYANIVPAVNQVEFSPYLYLEDLLLYCWQHTIQLQSYTPLVRGKKMNDPKLLQLAARYNKTPAQIILRWNIELKVSAIPKSATPSRIKENFGIFDFEISKEDMAFIKTFNEDLRVVDDPMTMW